MSLNVNIADDFATVVDWLNPVAVDGTAVYKTLRRAIRTKEYAESAGRFLSSDTIFHLDVAEYTSRPAIGGTIFDTDGDWTILEVAKQTLANRWRCISRKLYLDPSFTVAIHRASYAKSDTGAQEPTWAAVASDIVARVQIVEETAAVTHELRTSRKFAKVFFMQQQTITANDRIIAMDGTILKVNSWAGFDTTEQMFVANCEVSKWPQA